jgi:hypothetical protein
MTSIIIATAALIVAIVCTALVLHPEYEDGLIGRIALAVLAIVAVSRFPDAVESAISMTEYKISAQGLAMWIAVAVFFARHWYRFYKARQGRYLAGMRERRYHGPGGGGMEIQK